MRNTRSWFLIHRCSILVVLVSGIYLPFLPNRMCAQSGQSNVGSNAVWQNGPFASPAFIDAAAFIQSDICKTLHNIFTQLPTTPGIVIDARGVLLGSPQLCSVNPWVNGVTTSSTILLPAGTIAICAMWTPPVLTRIIGEGPNQGGTVGTMLQVGSSQQCGASFSGSAIIQMAPSCNPVNGCFSVQIEGLALDGQDNQGNYYSIDGIDNSVAQELSLVRHVSMVNIGEVGLSIGAVNSGPYSDISIEVTSNATACVVISGNPRGVHGLSCTCVRGGTACSNPNAGIYLGGTNSTGPAGNTSIEDIYINGFEDGIYVGRSGHSTPVPAASNVLFNIYGGSNVTNLIHIDGTQSEQSTCPPQNSGGSATVNNVCDLTILGATSSAGNTIYDQLNNNTTLPNTTDPTVGMYVIGEQVSEGTNSIGNSRFTTSPSIPTWIIGTTSPPTTPCASGDLYSITTGTSGNTLWGCVLSSPNNEWLPII
jgi:hypothetical protein